MAMDYHRTTKYTISPVSNLSHYTMFPHMDGSYHMSATYFFEIIMFAVKKKRCEVGIGVDFAITSSRLTFFIRRSTLSIVSGSGSC